MRKNPSAPPYIVDSAGVCHIPGALTPGTRVYAIVTYREIRGDQLPWSPEDWHPPAFFLIHGVIKEVRQVTTSVSAVYRLEDFPVTFKRDYVFSGLGNAIGALQKVFTTMTRGTISERHVEICTVEKYNQRLRAAHARMPPETSAQVAR